MENKGARRQNGGISFDLAELIWRILEQWKAVIAFAVIFMLIFSLVTYTKALSAAKAAQGEEPAVEVKTPEEILASLDDDSREMVQGAYRVYNFRNEILNYIDNSALMQLDAYDLNKIKLSWYVNADPEIKGQLVNAYDAIFYGDKFLNAVSELWGENYSINNVKELTFIEIKAAAEGDISSGVFNVSVIVPDESLGDKTIEIMKKEISEARATLSEDIGKHKISLLREEQFREADTSIADKQAQAFSRLYSIYSQILYYNKNLTDPQKNALNALITYSEGAEEQSAQPAAEEQAKEIKVPFFTKRSLTTGLLGGFVIYVVAYAIYFIFSGRVRSSSVTDNSFGIRTLSEWHSYDKGRLPGFMKDKAVFRRHHRGYMNKDDSIMSACDSISAFSKLAGEGLVHIIDLSDRTESGRDFVSGLCEKLKDNSVHFTKDDADPENENTISEQSIVESAGVALVLGSRTSMSAVRSALTKCDCMKVPVIGSVFIN